MPRLEQGMTLNQAIGVITENNFGSAYAAGELSGSIPIIQLGQDPQWVVLKLLDELEIYGDMLWKLYSRVCQERLERTAYVLLAVKFEVLSKEELHQAIADEKPFSNISQIMARTILTAAQPRHRS